MASPGVDVKWTLQIAVWRCANFVQAAPKVVTLGWPPRHRSEGSTLSQQVKPLSWHWVKACPRISRTAVHISTDQFDSLPLIDAILGGQDDPKAVDRSLHGLGQIQVLLNRLQEEVLLAIAERLMAGLVLR
jgi:hypothetical protein